MEKKKAKMGRPPMKKKDRLSEIVTLRLSPSDRKRLKKDARASGLCVSAYLQSCWHQEERK